jgi:hypothetical protein
MADPTPKRLQLRELTHISAPLAASWMMMGLELPLISAVVARLAEPETNLAAFGGIVFPLALLIESPIIMMLAASTALCRDEASYLRLKRFMMRLAVLLTVVHAVIAFTPVYDWIVVGLIDAPHTIIEPGRLGFQIMLPWTWCIADRRFRQGVLIRFGQARAVGVGTLVRLIATTTILIAGYFIGTIPGIAVGAGALTIGVTVEMIYARLVVAPIVRGPLRRARINQSPLSLGPLLAFYIPLALTPLLALLTQPIGSAAMSRMPEAILSLAAWPALNGLIFLCRSVGFAFNEVVVSTCDRFGALSALRRFATLVAIGTTLVLLLAAATPLGRLWFAGVCGLDANLTALARAALWFGVLLPACSVAQSFYQGLLVHAHRTRAIPESMALFLVFTTLGLGLGIWSQQFPGLSVTVVSLTVGNLVQTGWLYLRCRPVLAAMQAKSTGSNTVNPASE